MGQPYEELAEGGLAVLDSGLLAPNRACATCPSRQTNETARDPTPTPALISHRELSHRKRPRNACVLPSHAITHELSGRYATSATCVTDGASHS